MKNNNYNENSIKKLDYPECVRKRPTMYIGQIGSEGYLHLCRECWDNSVDEAINNFGKVIEISISNKTHEVTIRDEGRGIPHLAIEKAVCELHSSGKFDNDEYAVAGGLNGVGLSCVNALSKKLYIECTNDGIRYSQTFSKGIKVTELKELGKTKEKGTIVKFIPDETIMDTADFDIESIVNEIDDKSYVLPGITFIINDIDNNKTYKFKKDSFKDFIKNNSKESISNIIEINNTVNFNDKLSNKDKKFEYQIAFCFDKKNTLIKSFCNTLQMRDGGIQETSFKTAIATFFKNYITTNKLLNKKDEKLEINTDHCIEGINAIISIKHPTPIFENQTKNKLTNREIANIKKSIIDYLNDYSVTKQTEIKNICQKIILNAKAYEAAKNAKEKTQKKGENSFSIVSDLSKLANCISKDTKINEIFITEGRSASGSAKEGRDKNTQAVYSLRGKMLNTLNLPKTKVLDNKECADLAYILTGIKNGIDENFKIESLKYGKIIMLCDADVDGYHISMLGLTYIFEHMLPIITEGHMFIAIPPLYSIIEKGKKKYFVDQEEYDNYIYEKILRDFNFCTEDDKILDTVIKITNVFKAYDNLLYFSTNIANKNIGISKELLLNIFDYVLINGFNEKNIKNFINDNCPDIIYNNDKYEGFYEYNYVFFTITDIKNYITSIFKFIKSNQIPIGSIYYCNIESDNDEYTLFTLKSYDDLIKEVTPKSRVRLKGLGEMDPEELKETTLDVNKRNIYKVEISDIEKAKETMRNFMDGNAKYADVRKEILLRKQNEEEN